MYEVKKKLAVIQILLILVIVACVAVIGKYFYDNRVSQNTYDELRSIVEKKRGEEDASGGYEVKRSENGMLDMYYELYKQNSDMIGWIRIADTAIDYPVVRYSDNDFYLHKDFYKNYQYSGVPFADYQSNDDSLNTIIYAHNMKNGAMFASLLKYENREFYEKHKYIFYDTLYDKGKYEIISVFSTKVGDKDEFKYYEYSDIKTVEQFNEYTERIMDLSRYDTGITASYGDRLITLSTCASHNSNERFVVAAKKIDT